MATMRRVLMLAVYVALFSCVSSEFLKSLKHKSIFNRKPNSAVSKRQDSESEPKLFFKGRPLKPTTRVTRRHKNVVLECEAGGSPGPTIHWLLNGERIEQGVFHKHDDEAAYEDHVGKDGLPLLRLSTTRSKLVIDCISPEIRGTYTCVAETPYERLSQSTKVKVLSPERGGFDGCLMKKSLTGSVPHVYMWTATRVEFQDNSVQLFCRASGSPAPLLTWYDAEGEPIQSGGKYELASNGDLIIKNINWFDMGVYTCTAANKHGDDTADTFLYPTFRDEEEVMPPVYR